METYEMNRCPKCNCNKFLYGPSGGGAQDILCNCCGTEYCDTGFGLNELPRKENRAELYGLKKLPTKGNKHE